MMLQDIQSSFQQLVLNTECVDASWVSRSADSLSPKDRLAIYHNAYRVRLIDVLRDTFGHTVTYLGDEWFNQLARDFVQDHHSTHNNIGFYGTAFPAFLAEQLPDDLDVAELAELDWTLRRAFDGADSGVMTMEHLQILAQNTTNIVLETVPTLCLVTQRFNTLDIWHAIDQDNSPPVAKQLANPVDVLVWRKGYSPHFRSISPLETVAIKSVREGQSLDVIGETLVAQFPDDNVPVLFGQMLPRWIADELLRFDESDQ
ncbi:DNA-binding domain-containing protein [Enterovibrio sp. ZSDZ35]|uniref:DNA-binding domain-containing protein n=1 Tax=Enterovibrio qingdaonensis TaxID=2899818 RepID=A0ABT5QQ78_9GAMM|nr:DNA-binding domain-containing protein [Enterovibrio sp. ZSDZ35]MDD1783143.1 DNA-binding domain-containing protein [Enterovibrio sp. ZSDZ35]